MSLADLVQLIEAERPNIVCTEHDLVDQYNGPGSKAFVVKSRCDYRPGGEPFIATNHFVIVIREFASGRDMTTVEIHHGESLPPRLELRAREDAFDLSPAFSLDSYGWGMVFAFFILPIGFAALVFVLAVVLLRVRRSHRLQEVVPRRFVLNWRKPRPAQRRSHWTIIEENDSDEPG